MAGIHTPFPTMKWEGNTHPDDPNGVAPLAAYLLTDGAGDVNGQLLGLRGGEVYLYSYPEIERQILTFERRFTMDELDEQMPRTLANGVSNPVRA